MSAGKPKPKSAPEAIQAAHTNPERGGTREEAAVLRRGRSIAESESTSRMPRTFLDTNILAYADDGKEPVKRRIALGIIREHREQRTGVVSLQVLQEYFTTATKKLKLDVEIARNKVEIYSRFYVAEPTVTDILAAVDLYRLHGFSFWDALILRSASQTGCSILLTEDMQHGRVIDGLRIVNPFR